jgi:septal ring factor EnvC (AmiA/AmiB activator)
MDENKLVDAVVRAISGLEDSLKDEMKTLRTEMNNNAERTVKQFDALGNAILKQLTELTAEVKGLREENKRLADHEERIRKIEDFLYKKGA